LDDTTTGSVTPVSEGRPPRGLSLRAGGASIRDLADADTSSGISVLWNAAQEEYRYARWGLCVGAMCVILGALLTLVGAGAASTADWKFSVLGASSSITAATPGALCMIVGILMAYLTRPHVTFDSAATEKASQQRTTKDPGE